MSIVAQIILVALILGAMAAILLGIRRLVNFDDYDDPQSTIMLEREVEEDEKLISGNNVFRGILERQRCENSTSSGPSSRKL
ncbi:MAG: hypothetical protein K2F94_03580 [Muribaculaceae bacterium]|nr:hypothetical protein [Muribaculaceae bacterium]MDE6399296.1 hypothetical protein [Muribaculaceae bacterium]MDE6533992.1 hypothetical protein [Muribaculaceae bacterium]MDE6771488.1 hypothetical protein [Muribaculaceae bacterium]